ncbi:MAG: 30S ribosomal protein S20 [Candidatus Uhrbacteria bacterium]
MPNKANAWKALRQSKKRAVQNKGVKDGVTYLRRGFAKALAKKDKQAATEAYQKLQKALDRAAGKGVVKSNTASRLKSRAATKLHAIS